MNRFLFLVAVFGIIILSYFAVRNYQESYKILPAELPKTLPQPARSSDWYEFTPSTGNFSVLLPLLPQHATEKMQDRRYNMYVSQESNGTVFVITLISFDNSMNTAKTDIVLSSLVNDFISSNSENVLKDSKNSTFQNHKAIDFAIENSEEIINGKAFMVDNTLYVLMRASTLANKDDEEYNFFIHSFHLVPQNNGDEK